MSAIQRQGIDSRRYHLEYLGATALGFTLPVFQTGLSRADQYPLTVAEGAGLVVLLQFAVPLVLLSLRMVMRKFAPVLDILLYGTTVAVLSRLAQREYLASTSFWGKALVIGGGVALLSYLLFRHREALRGWLRLVGILSLAAAPLFLWQLHALPLFLYEPYARAVADRPPVILVVMDELSIYSLLGADGEIDGARFPNFRALQAESAWFRNTTANYPFTAHSFPSFLNSLRAVGDDPPIATSKMVKTLVADGYGVNFASPSFGCVIADGPCRTRAVSASSFSYPYAILQTTASYLVPYKVQIYFWPSLLAAAVDEEVGHQRNFFSQFQAGNLYLLHTLITHTPTIFSPHKDIHTVAVDVPPEGTWNGFSPADEVLYLRGREQQYAYADLWLGSLIDSLKQRGLWQQSVLVVIADHGSCNSAQCRRGAARTIVEPPARLAFVPFFLHAPSIAPRIDDQPAALVDMLPTVLAALGHKAHAENLDGRDLLADDPASPVEREFMIKADSLRVFSVPSVPPRDADKPLTAKSVAAPGAMP